MDEYLLHFNIKNEYMYIIITMEQLEEKECDICDGVYPVSKHNFEECYSLDLMWDSRRMRLFSNAYDKLSYDLTYSLSKDIKKKNGIYFTPPNTIQLNLEYIDMYKTDIKTILEPSCGSCEYIDALVSKYNHSVITGIEYNDVIFKAIQHKESKSVVIIHNDFLNFTGTGFDLIIGNPPYFVMKKKDVNKKYFNYFDGRPNIFILFIIKSLGLLNKNGILSFILPTSFINSSYYEKTRRYIHDNFNIMNIVECNDSYIETQQKTILVIVKNEPPVKNNFTYKIKNNIAFGTLNNVAHIKQLYQNSTSLSKLKFKAYIGSVVWNQCKYILTDDNTQTRLIYSSDIKNGVLVPKIYTNIKKKNFIKKKGITGMTLVINRGYGTGDYKMEYCLIDEKTPYLIENHLIYIRPVDEINDIELRQQYEKIIKSFACGKTKKFIEMYFGNGAINSNELNHVLPIYQDI
jgi:tRNA1(Val) A37 N6-methylase TrmN6